MKNLAHKAKSGLINVKLDYQELEIEFKETINTFLNSIFELEPKYRYVKINDPFFSDTQGVFGEIKQARERRI